jgi:eukaryotic-like serine/threonine-protein kinase
LNASAVPTRDNTDSILTESLAGGSAAPSRHAVLRDRSASQPELASLLQSRLRIVAAIWACTWLAGLTVILLTLHGDSGFAGRIFRTRIPFVAGGVLFNTLVLLALGRMRLSDPALRRGEVVFFLLNTLLFVDLPAFAFGSDGNPAPVSIIVLMRCIFIPDRLLRTLLVCLAIWGLFFLSCLAPMVLPNGDSAEILAPEIRRIIFISGNFAVAVHIAVGLVAVHIIHGLRMRAFQAEQAGSYRLQQKLGEGGMGEVYRARHAMLQRPTAVKMLRADLADSATALRRFEREVRAVSELTDPHTIAIYDFGKTDGGRFYYAMELLEGLDLQQFVDRHGPLPAGRAIFLIEQVLASLGEAHERGILHRDIKPSNAFLTARGQSFDFVKVLDFGLAKDLQPAESDRAGLTQDGAITGTPLYMAPERYYGTAGADHRSDLYAVGALLYFLLTGRPVFDSNSPMQVLLDHIKTPPTPPRSLGAAVSMELEAALLRALEKDPEARYATAGDFLGALSSVPEAGGWTQRDARLWWAEHLPEQSAKARQRIRAEP